MGNELATNENASAVEIKAQVNLIQQVMQSVMKKDTHYGIIKGCGDKPVLLKPGAEKILSTFRIAVDPVVQDLSTPDCARYRVIVRGLSMKNGAFLGAGVGECSSDEEKYKWKKASCDEEYAATPENRRRIKWIKAYNKPAYSVNQIRTNPADQANTILKMSKKRGQIDMCLTVTGASDIFTQDLDETGIEPQQDAPTVQKPQPKASEPKPTVNKPLTVSAALEVEKGKTISSIRGILIDAKTRTPKDKAITEYSICDTAYTMDTNIVIQVWGKMIDALIPNGKIEATNVIVQEFRGQKQYQAQKITKINE